MHISVKISTSSTAWFHCCIDMMSAEHTTLQMYSFSTVDVYEENLND